MSLAKDGRASREGRIRESKSGVSGTSSQDFMFLAVRLCEHSVEYARRFDRNCSIYAPAGIPVLFSALRCLLIELHAGHIVPSVPDTARLAKLSGAPNDVAFMVERYNGMSEGQVADLRLLWQVRNEIVHPSHRSSGDTGNTPAYLSVLRDRKLLQSTGMSSDYIWLSQLNSHRLLIWACELVESVLPVLLTEHAVPRRIGDELRRTYAEYRAFVAA